MYKSRVETFKQVQYFHHLMFLLFISQDDGMKNKLQHFIDMPKQKYTSVLCVWGGKAP